jgi:hypothetical protein
VWYFADFYLYAANSLMLAFLAQRVPRLLFAYAWIEGDEDNNRALARASAGSVPVIRIHQDFNPPLFYSLGCFAKHVLNGGKCFIECPKDFTRELTQGKNRFRVVVRDCVTYLFADRGKNRQRFARGMESAGIPRRKEGP